MEQAGDGKKMTAPPVPLRYTQKSSKAITTLHGGTEPPYQETGQMCYLIYRLQYPDNIYTNDRRNQNQ